MKKVVILTNNLDHTKESSITNLMDCKMVTSEDEITIIYLKKTQIDIINGERNRHVINASLGAVNSYIKHAKYVYIDDRWLMFDHLVHYLINDVPTTKIINEPITAYHYWAKDGKTPQNVCNAWIDIYNRAYENAIDQIKYKFSNVIHTYMDLIDLIHDVNWRYYVSIDDMINEEYQDHPDVGFREHPLFWHMIDMYNNPYNQHSEYNTITYDYVIAYTKTYVKKDEDDDADDFEPFISVSIAIDFNDEILPKLNDKINPVDIKDLGKYARFRIDLFRSKDSHGESLMSVEVPLSRDFVTEDRAITTTIYDKDWKTTLKNDGYADEVIKFAEELMNDFSSDKFFNYYH